MYFWLWAIHGANNALRLSGSLDGNGSRLTERKGHRTCQGASFLSGLRDCKCASMSCSQCESAFLTDELLVRKDLTDCLNVSQLFTGGYDTEGEQEM